MPKPISMKTTKKKTSNKRRSKIYDCQEYEFLNWNFPVEPPPMPGTHGLPKKHYDHTEKTPIESICGGIDESQDVELYDGTLGVTTSFVNDHERPVGQLQWNNNLASIYDSPGNVNNARWCSGTLVSRDLFLTAGHCFDPSANTDPSDWVQPRQNGSNQILSAAQIAGNMHVNFNYQRDSNGVLQTEESFPIIALVEYRLGDLDYALVRLAGNPGDTYSWTGISTVDADIADMLCVIQHPAGVPKRIEAGPLFHLHDVRLGYDSIDTLGGSSGSGVLRASTGLIVGVHTNGGCGIAANSHNHGVRITSIRAVSPIIPTLQGPMNTLKFIDDRRPGSFKFRDDIASLKFLEDRPSATFKFIDDGPITLKFSDDRPPASLKFRDDIASLKFIDDRPGGGSGSLKFIDDVKLPALDKMPGSDLNPGTTKRVGSDTAGGFGTGTINPGRWQTGRESGVAAPFILSTPHHSTAWAHSFPDASQAKVQELTQTIGQYEEELTRLETASTQGTLSEAEQGQAAQVFAEYQQLMVEYERLSQVDGC
jgi:V8-like Glu-specific endopeptidase